MISSVQPQVSEPCDLIHSNVRQSIRGEISSMVTADICEQIWINISEVIEAELGEQTYGG